ncbi:MAG: class I SAM-dependent methyltransferase [Dehalococcoidia bacterium]
MYKTIHRISDNLRRSLGLSSPWYRDLCDYYGVTPEQALKLGTRAEGRRPDLPGSPTTHALFGKTFEEIWASRKRDTPTEIHAFWQDMGAWATFRQVVYHRSHSFRYLLKEIEAGSRVCEYGAGVGPVSFWLVDHLRKTPLVLTIVDVPSEHLVFGRWRLQRRIRELKASITLEVREVLPDRLPLEGSYDIITMLEVYEHLHNPLKVTVHLCDHLQPGGLLWENYIIEDNPAGANLPAAQEERSQVYAYLRSHCKLIAGNDPDTPDSGGTRCWRRL